MIAQFLPSRLPIIQAPMVGSQGVELCAAVCEAGGLGSLPSAMLKPSELRDQIAEIRRRTPFAERHRRYGKVSDGDRF
jgi:nitronate monooxygenase